MIDTPFNSNEARVVDSYWFNYIGLIKVQDKFTGEYKYYIGQGEGKDQHTDEQYIAKNGVKVSPQALKMFFNM